MGNNDHIKKALHPSRFPGMSMKMAAIVGYIVENKVTSPAIAEMIVTSDGIIMARVEGDIGCNDMLGKIEDFKRNWDKLIHLPGTGLTKEEISYLEQLPNVMIRNYGE